MPRATVEINCQPVDPASLAAVTFRRADGEHVKVTSRTELQKLAGPGKDVAHLAVDISTVDDDAATVSIGGTAATTEPEGVIRLCGGSNFTVERQKDKWRCGVDTPIPPRACD